MAEISVNIDTEVDIDVEDFLDECSSSEIDEVIEWLAENDYKLNINDDTNKDLIKLINVILLTVEDEILLNNIANKYP